MPEKEVAPPTNRIDVPLAVRQNLGITFATVERRAVADTVRYPGVFELKSTARHQYVAPSAGRVEVLVEDYQEVEPGTPLFRVHSLEVVAINGGKVEPITVNAGALVDDTTLVVTVTDPAQLRFRAKALQSDLAKLHEGAPVRIVPLSPDLGEALEGALGFGLEANPIQRTVDLVIDLSEAPTLNWARPGISAVAEVVIEGSGAMEIAVPQRAIISDGLQRVLFRRAPDNPNQVIRLEADAGVSDGQWVEILSGLSEGDEVVLGGVYELMLGSSTDGARQEGGHFHGDGTFHEAH